jgi:hypothetical protein
VGSGCELPVWLCGLPGKAGKGAIELLSTAAENWTVTALEK